MISFESLLFASLVDESISEPDKYSTCDAVLVDRDNVQPVVLIFLDFQARFTTEQFNELRRRIAVADDQMSAAVAFQLSNQPGQVPSIVQANLHAALGRYRQGGFPRTDKVRAMHIFNISIVQDPAQLCRPVFPAAESFEFSLASTFSA